MFYFIKLLFWIVIILACNVFGLSYANGEIKNVTAKESEPMVIHDLSVKYVSSEDPNLVLYAAFIKTGAKPKPILAYLHGWYGNRYMVERDLGDNKFMLDRFFLVGVDMRGRGSTGRKDWWGTPDPAIMGQEGLVSGGEPDASGWGLNDIIDAIETVKQRYPEHVLADPVYVIGHSGGGGNTMSIIGKFPDYFTAAYAGSGMCDYERWAELSSHWRPSIERWVGAKLGENKEAFASHSGLTTVANRMTPIALSHGGQDKSVPSELSVTYVKANADLKKPVPFKFVEDAPHGLWGPYEEIVGFLNQYTEHPVLPQKGKLIVTGYIKTRKFQVILPSIHSIAECTYDFSDGLKLNLKGGRSGLVKVRLLKDISIASVECTSAGKVIRISCQSWHDWLEYQFEYADSATVTFHMSRN